MNDYPTILHQPSCTHKYTYNAATVGTPRYSFSRPLVYFLPQIVSCRTKALPFLPSVLNGCTKMHGLIFYETVWNLKPWFTYDDTFFYPWKPLWESQKDSDKPVLTLKLHTSCLVSLLSLVLFTGKKRGGGRPDGKHGFQRVIKSCEEERMEWYVCVCDGSFALPALCCHFSLSPFQFISIILPSPFSHARSSPTCTYTYMFPF